MKPEVISKVFSIFKELNPNPVSELNYNNSFELLCAVVLSAQTTDAAVNKVTPILFKKAPSPLIMSQLKPKDIAPIISTIGLYRSKAEYLVGLSTKLVTEFNSEVPSTEKDLVSLPGVGIKTARVILNIIFNKPLIAVDTHIFRVAKRMDMCRAKTPNEMSDRLAKIIPKIFLKDAHHHLILHGRYICTAKRPKCDICPIAYLCPKRGI
jgi:endonuclease III